MPRSLGVMVSTSDSESDDPSSNLSGTWSSVILTLMPSLGFFPELLAPVRRKYKYSYINRSTNFNQLEVNNEGRVIKETASD